MAIKKSEIYSAIWESCDNLRGGMDASLYKDYVLFMLFIKYVSDKFANAGPFSVFKVPAGSGFDDMRRLKGRADIGDQINKKIVQPLVDANSATLARTDFPDFNDATKLGAGKEMVDRLTSLIEVFENKNLDFSRNRADNDDLLGDAYEFLMRHFATESGKSKGQFYTPAEVSRVIARVIGIDRAKVTTSTTAYDPTCGSGSLLLKVAAEAGQDITLEGQEKDVMTAGLARMNMLLHGVSGAVIATGNTLAAPRFIDDGQLRTYDFVVANPPFSDKKWNLGVNVTADPWQRFTWGAPPNKQGDYAYLLHIIRSLNDTGKGACILPHGVLFRGNAESVIRELLVRSGYLKGIIGLPPNLFYGTGIPACILVLDKENAVARRGVFMLDASRGFMKDGNKNRLRERDIHRIVSVFTALRDVPGYARMVPLEEISSPRNSYNLNLPRYIDSAEPEDIHSLDAHLNGGIPSRDLDAMQEVWNALPGLRARLFTPIPSTERSRLAVERDALKDTIREDAEYRALVSAAERTMRAWERDNVPCLRGFAREGRPRELIAALSESLLAAFQGVALVDAYAVYQHLMDYWADTMQDDCYQIAADGWKAEPAREERGKRKKTVWECDLVPKRLVIARYFAAEAAQIRTLEEEYAAIQQEMDSLEEENSGEDGIFAELETVGKAPVKALLKEFQGDAERREDAAVLKRWLKLDEDIAQRKKQLRDARAALDARTLAKYKDLSGEEIRDILLNDKWLPALRAGLDEELGRVVNGMEDRLLVLADRYATPLTELSREVEALSAKVAGHLTRMGLSWN